MQEDLIRETVRSRGNRAMFVEVGKGPTRPYYKQLVKENLDQRTV